MSRLSFAAKRKYARISEFEVLGKDKKPIEPEGWIPLVADASEELQLLLRRKGDVSDGAQPEMAHPQPVHPPVPHGPDGQLVPYGYGGDNPFSPGGGSVYPPPIFPPPTPTPPPEHQQSHHPQNMQLVSYGAYTNPPQLQAAFAENNDGGGPSTTNQAAETGQSSKPPSPAEMSSTPGPDIENPALGRDEKTKGFETGDGPRVPPDTVTPNIPDADVLQPDVSTRKWKHETTATLS